MACCGQKRAALKNDPLATLPRPSPLPMPATARPPLHGAAAAPEAQPWHPSVVLRYTETSPILVRGPVSGRQYPFSAMKPSQPVDARDVAGLVRTGFFRRS